MSARIHILGASGSGVSTLGQALAEQLGCPSVDVDDYFWPPSDPPFQTIRDRQERQALLGADLDPDAPWVVSGSLCGRGDAGDVPAYSSIAPPTDRRYSRKVNAGTC